MKHYIAVILLLTVLIACDRENDISVGFSTNFKAGGYGMTILSSQDPGSSIYLEGTVRIDSGDIKVLLYYPDESIAYEETISGNFELVVDEVFNFAGTGDWQLKYTSNEGAGYIDLLLHN